MFCLSLSRPWELLFMLMHLVFRFLPSSSSHFCLKFHILTLLYFPLLYFSYQFHTLFCIPWPLCIIPLISPILNYSFMSLLLLLFVILHPLTALKNPISVVCNALIFPSTFGSVCTKHKYVCYCTDKVFQKGLLLAFP